MNRMVTHRGARLLANLLVFAFLAPVFGHLGAAAAYAQANRLTRQLRVVVLEVEDVSDEPTLENLGSLARDAVWVEMQGNRWFRPMPQQEAAAAIQRGEERNEFVRPLDASEQQKLAMTESQEGVASGYVRVLGVEGDPRIATVEMQLFFLDAATGMYINGATCVEKSDPRPGYDGPDSTLIQEAVNKAAHTAVDQMGRYEVVEGYVLAGEGTDTVRICVGRRDGVENGDRFVVLGRVTDSKTHQTYSEVRGVIEVGDARSTYSVCKRIESGRPYPVMTGDFVRRIFSQEAIGKGDQVVAPTVADRGHKSKSSKSLSKILLITALVVLVGVLLDQNGAHTTPGLGVRASGVNIPGLPNAMLRVRWEPGGAISAVPQARAGYIVGYEIHRGLSPEFPVTPNSMIDFLEGGMNKRYDDDSGQMPVGKVASIAEADETIGIYPVTIEIQDDLVVPTWEVEPTTVTYTYNYSPPVVGQMYYYAVRVLSKKLGAQPFPPTSDGDTEDEVLTGQLVVSVASRCGPATVIEPPTLVSPPDYPDPGSLDVNLDTQLFEWEAVQGADTYVIELSTDRTFPAKQTVRSSDILVRAAAGTTIARTFVQGGGQSPSDLFANWTAPIYWRVGARSSLDQYLPIDISGHESKFVFGTERSFQALELPPGTP